jgi:hypothetical protein
MDFDLPAATDISPDLEDARRHNLDWVRRTGGGSAGAEFGMLAWAVRLSLTPPDAGAARIPRPGHAGPR